MSDGSTVPMAGAIPVGEDKSKIKRRIFEAGLTGLANNIKWNTLITFMRQKTGWIPSYRSKWINGYISEWDCEWFYHLPFPFFGVLWFDISFIESKERGHLLDDEVIDHSKELIDFLSSAGFEFEKSAEFIRIFGYSPKDYEEFE